jgi:hypothetical protein
VRKVGQKGCEAVKNEKGNAPGSVIFPKKQKQKPKEKREDGTT